MTDLRIATDVTPPRALVTLPRDTVTSTIVVYGMKGMGKTVFGAVLAEELARARLRWAWLDPLGVAYGLRYSEDGKGKGVECLILGGPHGDIPIYPDGGAAVADVVVEESVNVLIDFSRKVSGEMWGVGEKIRFVTAYTKRLFQRQGDLVGGRRRENLFQILDEAARYIPQNIPAGNDGLAECVGAWQQFVEEGRNIGLGVCMLTQRSARINKDVAELADAMVAFRTVGPRSLGAVLDWLGEHVERERIKELSQVVRKLPLGSALLVSPGWLDIEKVVNIRMRSTFDSSATPKAGQRRRGVKGGGAKPSLDKIRERMAATIERAKEEDPKELRKVIAELKKQVAAKQPAPAPAAVAKVKRIEVPVVSDRDLKIISRATVAVARHANVCEAMTKAFGQVAERVERVERMKRAAVAPAPPPALPNPALNGKPRAQLFLTPRQPKVAPQRVASADGQEVKLGRCERALLTALAQRSPASSTVAQVSILSGYSQSSSGFANALSALRTAGLMEGTREALRPTLEGMVQAGEVASIPTGGERVAFWNSKLGRCERQLLASLVEAYPNALNKAQLSEAAGYSLASSGFANGLSKLRTLELIHGRDELKASEDLFS